MSAGVAFVSENVFTWSSTATAVASRSLIVASMSSIWSWAAPTMTLFDRRSTETFTSAFSSACESAACAPPAVPRNCRVPVCGGWFGWGGGRLGNSSRITWPTSSAFVFLR